MRQRQMSPTEMAVVRWLNNLSVQRKFSLTDLAGEDAPHESLKKTSQGIRPLTVGKLLASLGRMIRQDEGAAVAALHELLALASPRLVAGLLPAERLGPRSTPDVARATAELTVAAADAQRAVLEAEEDRITTPEETAEELRRIRETERKCVVAEAVVEQKRQAAPQLTLVGGAR